MVLVFCGFLCFYFFLRGAAEIKAAGPCRDPLFSLLKFLIRNSGVLAAGRASVGFCEVVDVPGLCRAV